MRRAIWRHVRRHTDTLTHSLARTQARTHTHTTHTTHTCTPAHRHTIKLPRAGVQLVGHATIMVYIQGIIWSGWFQILGFDILLLEDGKPMLLEVNSNPSLRIDYEREVKPGIYEYIYSQVDTTIKKPLVHDTLLLLAPRIYADR